MRQILIEIGADVNARTGPKSSLSHRTFRSDANMPPPRRFSGITPLHIATLSGNIDIVKELLANGAVQTGVGFGHSDSVEALLPTPEDFSDPDRVSPSGLLFGVRCRRNSPPVTIAVAQHLSSPA